MENILSQPHERKIIISVLCVVLLAHVVSFLFLLNLASRNPAAPPYPLVPGDSQAYALLADNLLNHGIYSSSASLAPSRIWPPGYPLVLAAMKFVTTSFTPVVLLQMLAIAAAVVCIYMIARGFVPQLWAAVPALLYGLDPMVVFSDTAIITDGLFSSLLVLLIYLMFFSSTRRSVLWWGGMGVALAALVMLRPIAEFLVVILPCAFVVMVWKQRPCASARRILLFACAYVLGVALILTPWIVRNYNVFGEAEIAHVGAGNLLGYNVQYFLTWREMQKTQNVSPLYPARHLGTPESAVSDELTQRESARLTPPGANPENYQTAVALHFIMQDPIEYAYFHIVNTIPFFLDSSVSAYEQIVRGIGSNSGFYAPTYVAALNALGQLRHFGPGFKDALRLLIPLALEILWWMLAVLCAVLALFFRRNEFTPWLLAGLVLYFALLTGPVSIARYRIPAEPYILILATLGAYEVFTRFRQRIWKTTAS